MLPLRVPTDRTPAGPPTKGTGHPRLTDIGHFLASTGPDMAQNQA